MSAAASSATPCRFGEIYLHTASESFDLHNCFDFVRFIYDAAAHTVQLRWFGQSPERRSLIVEMRGVTQLSATPRDPEMPFSEDACLSSVGAVMPSDPTVAAYSDVPDDWHHVFSFQSGFMLRIAAESVWLLPNDI